MDFFFFSFFYENATNIGNLPGAIRVIVYILLYLPKDARHVDFFFFFFFYENATNIGNLPGAIRVIVYILLYLPKDAWIS